MIFPTGASSVSRRTRIKICGITHPNDAALAVELGADALGLNFYPRSARCLDLARDGAWLRELPPNVRRVGVVVNASREEILRLMEAVPLDAVQLHGDEDEAFCAALRAAHIPLMKATRARDEGEALRQASHHAAESLLLDAYHPNAYGGTGQVSDWALAAGVAARHAQVILAGGLHAENVAEAIRQVQPFGVDVASGVERKGDARRKDVEKLRKFFAAVRAVDAEIAAKARISQPNRTP